MSSESAHQHAAGVDEERGTLPRRSWRQLWLSIHLYLGLFIGALLVILGLTGSIAVFWAEIDEWLNPELLTVTVPEQKTWHQAHLLINHWMRSFVWPDRRPLRIAELQPFTVHAIAKRSMPFMPASHPAPGSESL